MCYFCGFIAVNKQHQSPPLNDASFLRIGVTGVCLQLFMGNNMFSFLLCWEQSASCYFVSQSWIFFSWQVGKLDSMRFWRDVICYAWNSTAGLSAVLNLIKGEWGMVSTAVCLDGRPAPTVLSTMSIRTLHLQWGIWRQTLMQLGLESA